MKHKHHIIPRHMGGTDDPSNLIELTPEEHAEAHRKLYEEHGHWQDYVAWQGLAKLASKEEHVHMLLSKAGKKGNMSRIANGQTNKGKEYNLSQPKNHKGSKNPNAKEYLITYPDGTTEETKALKTWCESKGLKYNSFWNATIANNRAFKGYKAELL
jgi:hypothetical protein